jgi:dimeric dUTPase (all-alpha-NTP-PPase superfamily)
MEIYYSNLGGLYMERKNMVKVIEKFENDAIEIMEKNPHDDLFLVLNKQYDLMLNIIKTKNLYNYGIDNLSKNMILSIFDELNEYIDVAFAYELPEERRNIEALFELVDALHFIFQLHFLGTIKNNKYTMTEIFDDINVRNEIITIAINDFKTFNIDDDISKVDIDSVTIHELYTTMMLLTSEVLQYIHWKHWKTYKDFDYDNFINQLLKLYESLLFNFKLINGNSIDYKKQIVKYYITKNIENFDRQNRGY